MCVSSLLGSGCWCWYILYSQATWHNRTKYSSCYFTFCHHLMFAFKSSCFLCDPICSSICICVILVSLWAESKKRLPVQKDKKKTTTEKHRRRFQKQGYLVKKHRQRKRRIRPLQSQSSRVKIERNKSSRLYRNTRLEETDGAAQMANTA